MTYVIADIHGHYEKYKRLLREIGLGPDDTLYVLGDVLDRGPEPIKVLQDMMIRPNVIPILGNHEYMAAYCLRLLLKEITDESIESLDGGALQGLANWHANGGQTTVKELRGMSQEERLDILEYIGEFSLYEEITIGGKDYVLVHAGLGGFFPDRPLDDYQPYELLFSSADYDRAYYPDKYVVTGHTPTQRIPGNPHPGRIFRKSKHVAIDCGCGFGGSLAVLCLDTGEEFYA